MPRKLSHLLSVIFMDSLLLTRGKKKVQANIKVYFFFNEGVAVKNLIWVEIGFWAAWQREMSESRCLRKLSFTHLFFKAINLKSFLQN